jgi:PKHD-type hydroxylase
MIIVLKGLIPASLCKEILSRLDQAGFVDGLGTAGQLDGSVKHSLQLPLRDPLAREISGDLVRCLSQSPEFCSAVRLKRLIPPRINRYDEGMYYHEHLDNALMVLGQNKPIRTDVALTICLNNAADYEGGELVIQADDAERRFKGNCGDVIVYPADRVHQVTTIESGSRLVAVAWIQSQVRDPARRRLLFELDQSVQDLDSTGADRGTQLRLRQVYHMLVRMWSEP